MPKWKKGEREFKVSITYHQHRGCQAYLPKPIVEMLGNPKTVRFIVKKRWIEVESGDQILRQAANDRASTIEEIQVSGVSRQKDQAYCLYNGMKTACWVVPESICNFLTSCNILVDRAKIVSFLTALQMRKLTLEQVFELERLLVKRKKQSNTKWN